MIKKHIGYILDWIGKSLVRLGEWFLEKAEDRY